MEIIYQKPKNLTPYGRNAKRHPSEQVRLIANSIREFGFRQPVVVDRNNVVIIGHGRLLAAKRLKLAEIPTVIVDDLTDEQIRALRIADNSVTSKDWDEAVLAVEASELSGLDIDLSAFGVEIDLENKDEEVEDFDFEENGKLDNPPPLQHNAFDNQEIAMFESDNYYGLPTIMPTQTTGDKFLRFMDWNEVDDPENYIAHFFYDDFKFMQAWRDPDKYIARLKRFKAVIAPDFSSYIDFPIALQIMGAFRRQWCAAYWQYNGIDVIPDVQWGNEETYKWCFDGIPKEATVAISSLGIKRKRDWNGTDDTLFKKGFDEMIRRINPKTILWYGDKIEGCEGNIIHIPSFYEDRRELLNRQKDNKRKEKKND